LWFKTTNLDSDQELIYAVNGSDTVLEVWFDEGENEILCFNSYGLDSSLLKTGRNSIIDVDGWNHIVITYDYANLKTNLYLNNVWKAEDDAFDRFFAVEEVFIGSIGFDNYFEGTMDEIKIYNRVINETHINDLYTMAGEFPSLTPEVGFWIRIKNWFKGIFS